ncbi:hypothetical protein [Caballeronia sp. LZ043]|uniref:hypothetical protein n=1 Tax=Caballeronia sp. LZ043 TaxID=3038569 RepID=UPI0028595B57|nr:hypothetical protein [Caballeronia sp. LZ043]MDR5822366.1 hypothetical protein [Caballeronia sp. LZ043]
MTFRSLGRVSWVVVATGVSTLLLLGLLLADLMTDRALSRLPVDDALRIEKTSINGGAKRNIGAMQTRPNLRWPTNYTNRWVGP